MTRSPFDILRVSPQADDATIRRAYLARVRECPPERDPAGFQRIRTAYEQVRDLRARLEYELFHLPDPEELEAFAHTLRSRRPTLAQLRRLFAECLRNDR